MLTNTEVVELDGQPCFLANYIDITERKLIEKQIKELNNTLEKNILQLQSVNEELEAFSYSVSHDLRAPLRSIDGYTDILVEDHSSALDEEAKRIMNIIKKNTRRMGQLIDNLLSFSKITKKEIQRTVVDMQGLAQTALDDLKSSLAAPKARITIKTLPTANADYNLMHHVWGNLISNAIKYSGKKENPFIEIGYYHEGTDVVYYIQDNGIGFDMQYYNKLFGTFQRLHSTGEFEGTGVGLALVKRIITRHGGRIWANAEHGKGATFYFSLG